MIPSSSGSSFITQSSTLCSSSSSLQRVSDSGSSYVSVTSSSIPSVKNSITSFASFSSLESMTLWPTASPGLTPSSQLSSSQVHSFTGFSSGTGSTSRSNYFTLSVTKSMTLT
jgi:hypothetical protein